VAKLLTELTVREQTHIKTVANDRRESQEEVLNKWLIIHKEDGYMVSGQVRDTWRSINPGVVADFNGYHHSI
jgi:hypothetical protein